MTSRRLTGRRESRTTFGRSERDSREQQRQLSDVQLDRRTLIARPDLFKSSRFKTLVKQDESITVPRQYLNAVTAAVEEQKPASVERIRLEDRSNESRQAVKALSLMRSFA